MILVIIHLKVSAEKRKELYQAVSSLLTSIRDQQGCVRCDFFHRTEDKNVFCLLEEWATQKHLDTHYGSETYKVLRGTMNLLEEPCEIISYQYVPPASEMEGRC